MVTLRFSATKRGELIELFGCLDTFGNRTHAKARGKSGDRAHDGSGTLLFAQRADERTVDFDTVNWVAVQITEG